MFETVRSPRQILFGQGVSSTIPTLCSQNGKRVLVLTDRILLAQPKVSAIIQELHEVMESVSVFADAIPDVPLTDVDAALAVARSSKADVLLAIGGGTVIDLAKIVGVLVKHGGSPRNYYGESKVPGPTIPLIAVPTTSGTGSEVTPVSVLSDPERELKIGVSSVYLIPDFAIIDPELTLTCPPKVTAYSGADAFCHAVESYISRPRAVVAKDLTDSVFIGRNNATDDFALRAASAVGRNLLNAVHQGENLQTRSELAIGSMWAGLAFAHAGTGCPHAMQYPIGAATHTPHGLGVGLLLPYALTHVRDIVAERLIHLATAVGIETAGQSQAQSAQTFIDWTVQLMADIGLPKNLAEIGIERTDLPKLAEKTMLVTRLLQNHPGDTDYESLLSILDAAWLGDRDRVNR